MNTPKIGVIQALGIGYESVVRALWVVLIPIGLDLFFWLGPRLSIRTLFDRAIAFMASAGPPGPDFQQNLDDVRGLLSDVSSSLNLFSLLATDFMGIRVLPVPSLKAFELPGESAYAAPAGAVSIIPLDSPLLVAGLALLLLAVGLLMGVAYLSLIADRVRSIRGQTQPLPKRVLLTWVRLLLFVLAISLFYGVLSVPFLIAFGMASLVHIALGMLVLIAGWTISFWILLYLWFVAYAIVMDDVGVFRAAWNSANVVQRNLLSTFGFIVLTNLIVSGMVVIWQSFEGSALGTFVAIVGNAFIGSGLVAAAFVFYQDRLRAWHALKSDVRVASRVLR
jgi:hypothetical protein